VILRILIFMTLVLTSGCANEKIIFAMQLNDNTDEMADLYLKEYLLDFFEEAHQFREWKDLRIDSLDIRFNEGFPLQPDSKTHVIAQCNDMVWPNGTITNRSITIDQPYWNALSSTHKKVLLFHELGHCYLNRDHNDNMLQDGEIESIMHSSLDIHDWYFEAHKEFYLKELFTKEVDKSLL